MEKAQALVRTESDRRNEEVELERARERIRSFVRMCGVEQKVQESLAGAWARALEIKPVDLRQLLAAGIDPINTFFAERGGFEALEMRVAASRVAGGSKEEVLCQALTE